MTLSPADPRVAELVLSSAREFAILLISEDGRLESWSDGAQRIFGYAAEEVLGRPADVLFLPADLAAGAHTRELETARRLGRAEDSRWHVRKNGERFWGNGVTMHVEDSDEAGFLKILRDETPAKLAEEQRVLLLNELNHRIKNTLATVQSIAEQTLRGAEVDAATRERLAERLQALSKAHDLLVKESWAGADLNAVLEQAIAPHRQPGDDPFRLDGPTVRLSPQQAVELSLASHELTTNALKYGALSQPGGEVEISWNLAQDGEGRRYMNLLWNESGGPVVEPPQRSGFGARLLAQALGREGYGHVKLDYLPAGLQCVIELPLSDAEENAMLDLAAPWDAG